MGSSGSGTTTLGKELSRILDIPQEDSDNFFWKDTDPQYTEPKSKEDLHKLFYDFTSSDQFILSGDVLNWGLSEEDLLNSFTHIIYLYLPWETREIRIRNREEKRFGDRIKPGADMYQSHEDFIQWASKYELDLQVGRNKPSQKNFIKCFLEMSNNVFEIEKDLSLKVVVEKSLLFLK
jgi:adenylate kinase family enzyme